MSLFAGACRRIVVNAIELKTYVREIGRIAFVFCVGLFAWLGTQLFELSNPIKSFFIIAATCLSACMIYVLVSRIRLVEDDPQYSAKRGALKFAMYFCVLFSV